MNSKRIAADAMVRVQAAEEKMVQLQTFLQAIVAVSASTFSFN